MSEETAVSVAEDEGLAAVREGGEEMGAGALEEWAEGEVFEPAIGAGNGIEVGGFRWRLGHGCLVR